MEKLKILIVDDHDIVLRGMAQIVRDALGQENVTVVTASTGKSAIERASTAAFDLCILDVELPNIANAEIISIFRSHFPDTRIIVNTVHEEVWFVNEYIKSGVEGILFKTVGTDEIAKAIDTVMSGKRYYCNRAQALAGIIGNYEAPTPKELEVLKLLSSGYSTVEIARAMGITSNTVESHRRHLLDKFKARNVAELIMIAVCQGVLPLSK